MPNTCTTLNEVEACATALAEGATADGRVVGIAIQVAVNAIRSNHSAHFVEVLANLDAHFTLCQGHDYQPNSGGH